MKKDKASTVFPRKPAVLKVHLPRQVDSVRNADSQASPKLTELPTVGWGPAVF